MSQPVVVANDWRSLTPQQVGAVTPRLKVSVIMPTVHGRHLPYALAALAAQTWPSALIEVIVVDDGEQGVALPALLPADTKLIRTEDGWGPAAARDTGARHATGDVLLWLDDDMVLAAQGIEAQMRWHQEIDYAVVLGHKQFASADALAHHTHEVLRDELSRGVDPAALATGELTDHTWIDKIWTDTDDLATAGPRAMRVHVTATASCSARLYRDAGGFPRELVKGEDTVLGYRLREAGAVFVAERGSRSLHLGEPTVHRAQEAMNRFNKPFLADLVPEFRGHRTALSRSYAVPYVEFVLPVADSGYEATRATVDHLFNGSVPDVVVSLIGPWSALDSARRPVLDDPDQDLRLLVAAYSSDGRVRFVDAPAAHSDATFRLQLRSPDWIPTRDAVEELLREAERDHLGAITIHAGDGSVAARLERTAAARRGDRLGVIAAATWPERSRGVDAAGFLPVADAGQVPQIRGLAPWQPPRPEARP
jgi:glycosyltransferase involved in cell wall biosynthesis